MRNKIADRGEAGQVKTVRRVAYCPEVKLRAQSPEHDEENRIIEGRAVVFGAQSTIMGMDGPRRVREVIDAGAITQELLDASDIVMTMEHDHRMILARACKGEGTLQYSVTAQGVDFSFEAPRTAVGDQALEAVRRRDIRGCSFAFLMDPRDREAVEARVEKDREDGKDVTVLHVRRVIGVQDFTLTSHPAYVATDCQTRTATDAEMLEMADAPARETDAAVRDQVRQMREISK